MIPLEYKKRHPVSLANYPGAWSVAGGLYHIPPGKERRDFMYSDMRMDLILKLSDIGMGGDQIGAVLNQLDIVAGDYTISKASKEIAVRGRDDLERCAKLYVVCKQIEGCKQATINNYALHIKGFINYCTCPLKEIDANCIRKYLLLYKMDHEISDRSLDSIRGVLSNWFLWMQNEGYITKNPCANIAKMKYKIEKKPALDQTELERLRDVCRTDRERALVEALYTTGCRISEMLSIKVKEIKWDLPQPECRVIGKGDKPGTVYFSPRSVFVIKRYLASRPHDSEWLFNNERGGGRMSRSNAEKIFRQLRALAGLQEKRLTPHTIRHTTATAAAKVAPIQVVRHLMRHDKIDTTMIYADTSDDDARAYHAKVIV